jgi:hypothetical protein
LIFTTAQTLPPPYFEQKNCRTVSCLLHPGNYRLFRNKGESHWAHQPLALFILFIFGLLVVLSGVHSSSAHYISPISVPRESENESNTYSSSRRSQTARFVCP